MTRRFAGQGSAAIKLAARDSRNTFELALCDSKRREICEQAALTRLLASVFIERVTRTGAYANHNSGGFIALPSRSGNNRINIFNVKSRREAVWELAEPGSEKPKTQMRVCNGWRGRYPRRMMHRALCL